VRSVEGQTMETNAESSHPLTSTATTKGTTNGSTPFHPCFAFISFAVIVMEILTLQNS